MKSALWVMVLPRIRRRKGSKLYSRNANMVVFGDTSDGKASIQEVRIEIDFGHIEDAVLVELGRLCSLPVAPRFSVRDGYPVGNVRLPHVWVNPVQRHECCDSASALTSPPCILIAAA
jgi:hypothetical protein